MDDKILKKKKKIGKECEECAEYKSGWQRARADYINLQKEIENRKTELVLWSKEQIIGDFIPVYDNFKKAFAHKPEEGEKNWSTWADGIGFIMKQCGDVLKQHGIEEIKTVGEGFNPELHEAVGEEESGEAGDGVILKEVDAGYMMKEKVIKPAKVIICRKSNTI